MMIHIRMKMPILEYSKKILIIQVQIKDMLKATTWMIEEIINSLMMTIIICPCQCLQKCHNNIKMVKK